MFCVCVYVFWDPCAWHFSCWEIFFSTCFASFFYFVIHCILFHYIHAFFGFFVPSWSFFIIFIFLGWSSLASCTLCQSWQKGGEIVENMWFLFKILHVRGRNTCLYKGELCFILLGGSTYLLLLVHQSCDHVYVHCAYLWYIYIYI